MRRIQPLCLFSLLSPGTTVQSFFAFHDTDISEVDGLIGLQAAPWSGFVW